MNSDHFEKINKVFILSAGRTGTKFLGDNYNKISNEFYSVHEPDRVTFSKKQTGELIQKLFKQGVTRLVLLKAIGYCGTRNLSLKAINKELGNELITKRLIDDRKWTKLENNKVYIESNHQLFGMIDILETFSNSKTIIIFRDPREWVKSWMNKGIWYTKTDILSLLDFAGFKRITPKNVGVHSIEWTSYCRFQKLCWVWNFMNRFFVDAIEKHNLSYFYFENLFIRKDSKTLEMFLVDSLGDLNKPEYVESLAMLLNTKVNENTDSTFPGWEKWGVDDCRELQLICGNLMSKLGYGNEPEWIEKIQ